VRRYGSLMATNAGSRVTHVRDGTVSVITMDDGKVNAVNHALLDDLDAALEAAAGSRAIVLAGRPGVFSGGFDLAVVALGGPDAELLLRRGAGLVGRLYGSEVPIVAACTGHAVALGAVLLMAADLRVGARGEFSVGLNEVAIGIELPPALIMLAQQRLAATRLTEAVLLARMWTPDEAVDVGFLDVAVDPDTVLSAAIDRAKDLGTRLQPDSYQATRAYLRGSVIDRLGR